MADLTPAERTLRAKIAANTRWAKATSEERRAHGERGSRDLLAKFEREVDPEGTLDPEERRKRAVNARNAHMARLALKSAKARRKAGGADAA